MATKSNKSKTNQKPSLIFGYSFNVQTHIVYKYENKNCGSRWSQSFLWTNACAAHDGWTRKKNWNDDQPLSGFVGSTETLKSGKNINWTNIVLNQGGKTKCRPSIQMHLYNWKNMSFILFKLNMRLAIFYRFSFLILPSFSMLVLWIWLLACLLSAFRFGMHFWL